MSTPAFAAAVLSAIMLASIASVPDAALAADLAVQEQSATCHTVFTGMPRPPYFTRYGCIHNVITKHRLPEHSDRHVILQQRDVVIEPPLHIDVYE